jgi:hypothetical protein
MEDEEDDIDMAAAMGFSSFGGTKKRKYDQTNPPKPKADASGANSTQLGMRTKKTSGSDPEVSGNANESITSSTKAPVSKNAQKQPPAEGLAAFLARAQILPESTPQTQGTDSDSRQNEPAAAEMITFGGPSVSKAELNALRFGVRNEHGDTAYFLPNFVENPWENMKNRK